MTSDIERLLQLHGPSIDFAEVRRTVSELSGALERPELLTELERIARSASAAKRGFQTDATKEEVGVLSSATATEEGDGAVE